MNKKIFLSLIILFLFLFGEAWGFTPITKGVGARPLGMGRAFAGQADDGFAIFTNPAGAAYLQNFTLTNMYSNPFANSRHILLGGTLPRRFGGTIGLGYNNFTNFNTLVSAEVLDQINQEFLISYSRKIKENFALGGNLKFFLRGLSKDVSAAVKASGLDLDLSLKYIPKTWLGIGANFQNILPTSLGGKITKGNGATEGISANYKAGVSAKIWGGNALFNLQSQELFFNLDLDKTSGLPALWHCGLEWWPIKFFALRGGVDQMAAAVGNRVFANTSLGIGLKYAGITFDYAYYQLGEATRQVEHYFSIGYIGYKEVKKIVPPTAEATVPLKRKHFKDVPEGYWAKDPIEILAGIGIISGYPDETFRPENTIARAEMCALLMKARGTTDEGRWTTDESSIVNRLSSIVFKDVPEEHWAADYIKQAAAEGIVSGYPDGSFKPNDKINRLEGVIMIARIAGLPAARVIEAPYSDLPGRHWAAPYVTAAKEEGLLKFMGDEFKPKQNLTRAEAAEILYQAKYPHPTL